MPRDRSRQRWEDKVNADPTGIAQRTRVEDSDKWKGVIETAKVLRGLWKLGKKKKNRPQYYSLRWL